MKPFTIKDIIDICEGELFSGSDDLECFKYSKDTRSIKENDIYIGIKGEHFDGNKYYLEAFNKGALACILDKSIRDELDSSILKPIILVDDTIKALHKLASYRRNQYDIPVIGITGSVGKTSTKDMIASVLSSQYKVLKTEGNYNNEIGLPLTLLELRDHTAAVLEMGMQNLGDIKLLSKIAQPTIAVITNIGTSHIGNLGSRENILKAKMEIITGLKKDGILIINNDNDLLRASINNINIITCGIKNKSNIMATNIEQNDTGASFTIVDNDIVNDFAVKVGTLPFIYNSLLAYAVGRKLDISMTNIQKGILEYNMTKDRMEIIETKQKITIINDTYNASYDSMVNALDYLSRYKGGRKIAILGDVFELGEYADEIHEKIGDYVASIPIDYLIALGKAAKTIANQAKIKGLKKVFYFENIDDVVSFISSIKEANDVILVKASHAMNFIKIVEILKAKFDK